MAGSDVDSNGLIKSGRCYINGEGANNKGAMAEAESSKPPQHLMLISRLDVYIKPAASQAIEKHPMA